MESKCEGCNRMIVGFRTVYAQLKSEFWYVNSHFSNGSELYVEAIVCYQLEFRGAGGRS